MIRLAPSLLLAALAVGACAMVHTSPVADLARPPDGVRVYAPRVYLLVDAAKQKTTVLVAPDFRRAYDVKPLTVFAKQDFKVELDDGILKSLTASQDTTAFLTFVKQAAELGAKASGAPVSQGTIDGSFGLPSGIYELTDDGRVAPVAVLPAPRP